MNNRRDLDLPESDDRPLPLIVADMWDFPLQYVADDEDEYFYAIEDWIAGITSEESRYKVQQSWDKMKKKLSISVRKSPFTNAQGRVDQKDFTDDNGLYLIAQNLRVTKARTALAEIKEYLAKAGVFVDDIRTNRHETRDSLLEQLIADNPDQALEAFVAKYRAAGKTDQWIERRLVGMIKRKNFTEALTETSETMARRPTRATRVPSI
jgi:hypothetical protein